MKTLALNVSCQIGERVKEGKNLKILNLLSYVRRVKECGTKEFWTCTTQRKKNNLKPGSLDLKARDFGTACCKTVLIADNCQCIWLLRKLAQVDFRNGNRAARARLRRSRQPEEKISIFILLISNEERILYSNVNMVVWGQVISENSSLPVTIRVSKNSL